MVDSNFFCLFESCQDALLALTDSFSESTPYTLLYSTVLSHHPPYPIDSNEFIHSFTNQPYTMKGETSNASEEG